ncbi:hypothetical protein [Novosphingobium sp. 9U]|uniref:hypothetical protein n=1 Tax=Novosphingobium sp. 9U TaxID=2653158 RepID=UPI0012F0C76F|nr:hypothetical protein [Novosphingobium sp. 9U]VWX48761.1 conserved membrane hypothetical protein [Novosphingobium sp. 9U]
MEQDDVEHAGGRLLPSSLGLAIGAVIVCAALGFLIKDTPAVLTVFTGLARFFLLRQDIPVAGALILFYGLILVFGARGETRSDSIAHALRFLHAIAIAVVIAMALTAWCLRRFVLFDFDLSRDEQMVAFDAGIFSRGQLVAPFPAQWREWYEALNATFILPIGDREAWISAYLPGNAALHAALSRIMPDALISPLLLMIAGLALWRIARRIWPESPSTQTVVLLLFAGSSQAIVMGATRYAMTAHLAANLVWLWLFLQRRPVTDAGAIAVGFIATGLHQPLFHPLFVLPFLDLLRREKQWRLLAVYVLCYGAIGLFWLSWPGWVSSHGVQAIPAEHQAGGVSYLDRFRSSTTALGPVSFGLMGVNLLRFVAWQHLLLLPLMIVGLRSSLRAEPLCRALALGIALLVLAMLLLLPAQAHGWGYRYLHGFLGSAVLIAGFGWHRLERAGAAPMRVVLWGTALSVLALLPFHVWLARSFIAPYAQASAALSRSTADLLIVDDWPTPFATDLVRNRPDLSNRPIMLQATELPPAALTRLCAGGRTLAFADTPRFAAMNRLFGNDLLPGPSPAQHRLHQAADAAGCRVVSL